GRPPAVTASTVVPGGIVNTRSARSYIARRSGIVVTTGSFARCARTSSMPCGMTVPPLLATHRWLAYHRGVTSRSIPSKHEHSMLFVLPLPPPAPTVDAAARARAAEALGFESLWSAEHPIMPVPPPSRFPGSADGLVPESYSHFVDPFVALARASGATTT